MKISFTAFGDETGKCICADTTIWTYTKKMIDIIKQRGFIVMLLYNFYHHTHKKIYSDFLDFHIFDNRFLYYENLQFQVWQEPAVVEINSIPSSR